jgi:dCTP deaminase
MIITGDRLLALIQRDGIVSNPDSYDVNSITLTLGREILRVENEGQEHVYGQPIRPEWVKRLEVPEEGILLEPHSAFLAMSEESVSMPPGHLGLLQTKGSLARLFITVSCCDAQIDPGYQGRITFEIVNLAGLRVRLLPGTAIAQLFIAECTAKNGALYRGRYQGAQRPTIQAPEK